MANKHVYVQQKLPETNSLEEKTALKGHHKCRYKWVWKWRRGADFSFCRLPMVVLLWKMGYLVVRVSDLWLKGCEFESQQEQREIFFSRVNCVCWLSFGVHSTPGLLQWHVKDPSHSAKSAGGRLHPNTHTPLTQQSQSGLTMPLSRHSVGTYPEISSHATCQGTFGHSHLSPLWTDAGIKSVISVCKLISTSKKKKKKSRRVINGWTLSQNPRKRGKSHHHNDCSIKIYATECFFVCVFFPLNFSSSGCSHVGMLFSNEEQKKGWLMAQQALVPHMAALFMWSLTQIARQKLAALMAVFFWLSNVD